MHSYFYGYDPLIFSGLDGNEVECFNGPNGFITFFRERLIEFLNDEVLIKTVFGGRSFTHDPLVFFDQIDTHYQTL